MPMQLDGLITTDDIADIAERANLLLADPQRISILETMNSIDVQACPGSGKTTLIAAKLILLARKWPSQHQGVCVLSHTNVAKDEIIHRINSSKVAESQRLLSYPHFIGTIQEFVNRFLSLPYLRSKGIGHITIDNDQYVNAARYVLGGYNFTWLRGTISGLGADDLQDDFLRSTFRACTDNGSTINMSRIARGWRNPNYLERAKRDLARLKNLLDERGFFLFRDMYTHAQCALVENKSLGSCLANRFPFILIDEMQDTQKFQDSLLCMIFPPDVPNIVVQRFGDPDQAIFSNISGEDPNDSYNYKSTEDMNYVIHGSHRFSNDVATKIKNFSFNCVGLQSEVTEAARTDRIVEACSEAGFNHTIIIFNDDNINQVVPAYGELVAQQFSQEYKSSSNFCAKVVGAVGNEVEVTGNHLKIGHYWSDYDKTKTTRSFKESTLIEGVRFCRRSSLPDWASSYSFLKGCILKLLRYAGITDNQGKNFTALTLRTYLKDNGRWGSYRRIMYALLCDSCLDEESWGQVQNQLSTIFAIDPISPAAAAYLAFAEERAVEEPEGAPEEGLVPIKGNVILHSDGFAIEVSTIHAVKGETHDATLVLETKNHCFDLGTMIDYLTQRLPSDEEPNRTLRPNPHATARIGANQKFMRQLYVAMSRPKHLLCLAIHCNRISPDQRLTLERLGWTLQELPRN